MVASASMKEAAVENGSPMPGIGPPVKVPSGRRVTVSIGGGG